MSIVVRFSPIALTAEKYAEATRVLTNAGEWPPAGCDYHVCFGLADNLMVSEIWNSREQFEAFGKRLMPILAAAGIQLASPPDISRFTTSSKADGNPEVLTPIGRTLVGLERVPTAPFFRKSHWGCNSQHGLPAISRCT